MRRLLLHLAIAIIAFAVGVGAAMLFGIASPARDRKSFHKLEIQSSPNVERRRGCKMSRELGELPPLPEPPAPPEPVAPPAGTKVMRQKRIVVQTADGNVQVVEAPAAPPAEQF
jgi:hypothetical protein